MTDERRHSMKDEGPKLLKDLDRAHTLIFVAIHLGILADPEKEKEARLYLNVLCWALGHNHNTNFETSLERIAHTLQPWLVNDDPEPAPATRVQ